jgi:hypothetical protein
VTSNLLTQSLVDLKSEIREAAQTALGKFEIATGLTVEKITIEMIEVTTYNDHLRRFSVSAVRIKLPEV